MLNKFQRAFLEDELNNLTAKSYAMELAGNEEKKKLIDERHFQTYKILDILLELEGKEIETIC